MKTIKLIAMSVASLTFGAQAYGATLQGTKAVAVQNSAAKQSGFSGSRAVLTPGILKKPSASSANAARAANLPGLSSIGGSGGTNTGGSAGGAYVTFQEYYGNKNFVNGQLDEIGKTFERDEARFNQLNTEINNFTGDDQGFADKRLTKEITKNSTHLQIPTSKAVYDFDTERNKLIGAKVSEEIKKYFTGELQEDVGDAMKKYRATEVVENEELKFTTGGAVARYISSQFLNKTSHNVNDNSDKLSTSKSVKTYVDTETKTLNDTITALDKKVDLAVETIGETTTALTTRINTTDGNVSDLTGKFNSEVERIDGDIKQNLIDANLYTDALRKDVKDKIKEGVDDGIAKLNAGALKAIIQPQLTAQHIASGIDEFATASQVYNYVDGQFNTKTAANINGQGLATAPVVKAYVDDNVKVVNDSISATNEDVSDLDTKVDDAVLALSKEIEAAEGRANTHTDELYTNTIKPEIANSIAAETQKNLLNSDFATKAYVSGQFNAKTAKNITETANLTTAGVVKDYVDTEITALDGRLTTSTQSYTNDAINTLHTSITNETTNTIAVDKTNNLLTAQDSQLATAKAVKDYVALTLGDVHAALMLINGTAN
ncbi:MAG: hypothetical protein LBB23_00125 [Rickettsiales bacterium]|jgi:hypothetical protein|nr:hypothetical protein [Rickettsiales bacterium]